MKIVAAVFGLLLAAVLAVGVWAVSTYNGFVSKQEDVNKSWAQVQNVYQRRLDLVPNLVATVQGSANFEKSTLTAVTEARASATGLKMDKSILDDPAAFKRFQAAQDQLGGALARLLVAVEAYPQLRSTEGFRDLQVQLEGTENRIAVERRNFNESAQNYNVSIRRVPANIVAGFAGFKERPYFEAEPTAQTAPKVKFN